MGLKLGLYVFHHNNNKNFNLINIYSAKTLMFCFANFFFHNVACFMPFWDSSNSFFTPPPTRSTGPSLTSSGDQSTFIICSGQKIKEKDKKSSDRTDKRVHACKAWTEDSKSIINHIERNLIF